MTPELISILLASVGVLLIGISKAGFGAGLAILTTPISVMGFTLAGKEPVFAVGVLLPLLCLGDLLSLYYYWRKWEVRNLYLLLPGIVVGIVAGVYLMGRFSPRQFNLVIGILALSFVFFQLVRARVAKWNQQFTPTWWKSVPYGIASGFTSTFAHGAGPVVTVFLLPQRMAKEIYVGTSVLIFTWINALKLPFYIGADVITMDTVRTSAAYIPLLPFGVWLGLWLQRRVSDRYFTPIILGCTFLAGLQLICNWDIGKLLRLLL
jgi:hypothetical protein